jgi:hypothetical protein
MKTKPYIFLILSGLIFASCEGFLDTLPDNRAQLNTEKKIAQLLVSAYPGANYAVVTELSSDNFIDNNAILPVTLSSFERMHEEIFEWKDVTSSTQEDSPSYIWERTYAAIAAANQALESIEELKIASPELKLDYLRGEALLCRAYGHFLLVNIFAQAYKDETSSVNDQGIPYATKPGKVVNGDDVRESVQAVYAKIQQDLEEGIGLITDHQYKVPKYHFNKKAASAFAARFYLYKRDYAKVIQYANEVLGANPASLMRDWTVDYDNPFALSYDYISTEIPCNLMLVPTSSVFNRTFGTRYGHNGTAMEGALYGSGPTWNGMLPCYIGKLYISGEQDYGVFYPKCFEMFEYTDKVAGIGYAHVMRAEFTVEETLLCRAEALVYLNRLPEALSDLEIWNKSRLNTETLTESKIKSFYVASNSSVYKALNSSKMSSSFTVSTAQLPYIQCVLHFRRIETIFDGYRWFDLKRYGIEIEHAIGKTEKEKLTYNDPRRAIQIPQEVISAGIEPNPRTSSPLSSSLFRLAK